MNVKRLEPAASQNEATSAQKTRAKEASAPLPVWRTSSKMRDRHWQRLTAQIEERRVEPNSSLGAAIRYMRNHWEKLTGFLRTPGAPLDNNVCERALKKAILHRENAYFYKTENGAHVGDLFMSLIHTCELNSINPFDYLTRLLKHADELAAHPADWMPWNYRDTLQRCASPRAS